MDEKLSNNIVSLDHYYVHNNGRVNVKMIRLNGKAKLTFLSGLGATSRISLLSCFTVLFKYSVIET